MKKMISILLCFTIVVFPLLTSTFISANADSIEYDTYADTLVLTETDDGIFEVANPNSRSGTVVTSQVSTEIYANSNELFMRIDSNRFIIAESLEITSQNYENINEIALEYNLSSEILEDISSIMENVASGTVILNVPITVYIPERIQTSSTARSTITSTKRTYTGYAGYQYYEEILDCSGNSLEFNVKQTDSVLKQYLENVFYAAAESTFDGIMSAVAGPAWTLASILAQTPSTSIATTTAYTHTAKLFENKITKYTYIIIDGEYFVGSVIDYAYDYFFRNFINIDGKDFYSTGDTSHFSAKATGYDNADEYAYRTYADFSYNNSIMTYIYKNTTLNITTEVSSLF